MTGLVLFILVPMVFVLIAVYFVFNTAKEYERKAVGWALTTVVAGFCIAIDSANGNSNCY